MDQLVLAQKRFHQQTATLIILLCAVAVAAGEGYVIGKEPAAPVPSATENSYANSRTPTNANDDGWDKWVADQEAAKRNKWVTDGGSVVASSTPTRAPNLTDKTLAETPEPLWVIRPEEPKKAKPAPVLGYATVWIYEEDLWQRCAFNTGDRPCYDSMIYDPANVSDGKIATLKKGDRVEILSAKTRAPNGTDIYKVRFHEWTGWMNADRLTLEVPGQPHFSSPNSEQSSPASPDSVKP